MEAAEPFLRTSGEKILPSTLKEISNEKESTFEKYRTCEGGTIEPGHGRGPKMCERPILTETKLGPWFMGAINIVALLGREGKNFPSLLGSLG